MNMHTTIHAVLGAALLTITACGDNGGDTTTAGTTTANTDPGTTTVTPTTGDETTVTPTTVEPTTTTVDPTNSQTTTTVDPTTVDPTTGEPDTTGTTGGDGGFVFPTDPFDAYVQNDRHAAVEAGTAGIAAAQGLGFKMGSDIKIRDMYNASNPKEDAGGMWVPEITKSVTFFHMALDDDLLKLKLVPATVPEALMQAGPVIVPDTIKYDPSKPTSYPNGRKLEDQVVDITLAAVLLKLGPNQPLDILAKLPLNPKANDVAFSKDWPYLAPPHPPKP